MVSDRALTEQLEHGSARDVLDWIAFGQLGALIAHNAKAVGATAETVGDFAPAYLIALVMGPEAARRGFRVALRRATAWLV